ncbi:hypothetical protein EYC84_000528 [Monilinia fructicola]|uniref:Uncharacterized protein n=1 Tax=Monilinia fructicola TaxID=38448 RepID=A0A5M9JTR4_MONFR|nr:hypothetical protein EYC84_000528 [Monilinia fructicola]
MVGKIRHYTVQHMRFELRSSLSPCLQSQILFACLLTRHLMFSRMKIYSLPILQSHVKPKRMLRTIKSRF